MEVYQPSQQKKMMVMELQTVPHHEHNPTLIPFFLESVELVAAHPADFLPPNHFQS